MRLLKLFTKPLANSKVLRKFREQTCLLESKLTSDIHQRALFSQKQSSQIPVLKSLNPPKKFNSTLSELGLENDDDTEELEPEATGKKFKTSIVLLSMLTFFVGCFVVLMLGGPEEDENGTAIPDEFSNQPLWRQYLLRVLKEANYYRMLIMEPSKVKLLPDRLGFPYSQPKYTLVIELTDILVHSEWSYATGWQYKLRPGLQFLLETLHTSYEIVIYISEPGLSILPLVEAVDPNHLVAYKLVREGSIFSGGIDINDLDSLNRDPSKVIVVDWNPKTVEIFDDNLLNVKKWEGDDDDMSLIDLALFLKTVAENDIDDVREVLRHYRKFEDPVSVFRENQKKYIDHLESIAAKERLQVKEQQGYIWLPKFLRKH